MNASCVSLIDMSITHRHVDINQSKAPFTRALLRLERTMNLLEGGKRGEGRVGERGWGGDGGRVGRGRGGEREGGE